MIKNSQDDNEELNLSESSDEPAQNALNPVLKSKYKGEIQEDDEENEHSPEDEDKSQDSDNLNERRTNFQQNLERLLKEKRERES